MFKAMKVCRRLKMLREQQTREARRFEKGYESVYGTKPSFKRGEHINKLLKDHQSLMLKERISPTAGDAFCFAAASRAKQRKSTDGTAQASHRDDTAMSVFLRGLTRGQSGRALTKALKQSYQTDRKDKAMQALKCI